MIAGLEKLGIHTGPSAANFVLADFGQPAGPVYDSLLRSGIIVRPVANYGLANHLRITVGTTSQNEMLLEAIAKSLQAGLPRGA